VRKLVNAACRYSWRRPPSRSRRCTTPWSSSPWMVSWAGGSGGCSSIARVGTVAVVMGDVDPKELLEVATPDDQQPVQTLGPDRPHPALGVRSTSPPSEPNTSSNPRQNVTSRSWTRKRTCRPRSPSTSRRLRPCWVTQRRSGLAVIPVRCVAGPCQRGRWSPRTGRDCCIWPKGAPASSKVEPLPMQRAVKAAKAVNHNGHPLALRCPCTTPGSSSPRMVSRAGGPGDCSRALDGDGGRCHAGGRPEEAVPGARARRSWSTWTGRRTMMVIGRRSSPRVRSIRLVGGSPAGCRVSADRYRRAPQPQGRWLPRPALAPGRRRRVRARGPWLQRGAGSGNGDVRARGAGRGRGSRPCRRRDFSSLAAARLTGG
jgi:hypothetical protein